MQSQEGQLSLQASTEEQLMLYSKCRLQKVGLEGTSRYGPIHPLLQDRVLT